jgi:hypothetical protein
MEDSNSSTVTIGSQSTWTRAPANTAIHMDHIERFTHSANSRVTYTGAKQRTVNIMGNVTLTGQGGDVIRIGVARNGNTMNGVIVYSKVSLPAGTNRYEVLPLMSHARLDTGDDLALYIYNETGARNVTISGLNLIISEIGV